MDRVLVVGTRMATANQLRAALHLVLVTGGTAIIHDELPLRGHGSSVIIVDDDLNATAPPGPGAFAHFLEPLDQIKADEPARKPTGWVTGRDRKKLPRWMKR